MSLKSARVIDCEQFQGRGRQICSGEVWDDHGRERYLSKKGFSPYEIQGHLEQYPSQGRPRPSSKPDPPRTPNRGVGSSLKRLLSEHYNIKSSGSCACNKRAGEMDRNGVEWVEQNIETVVGWLMEGAAERVWLKPFVRLFPGAAEKRARRLIQEAIKLAKGESLGIETLEWAEPVTKNLIYHVWPVAGYGTWQWNVDRVLQSIDQFNGKRIMAIAYSSETDSPETVQRYVEGHGFEFVVTENNPKLREVKPFVPMLERIESDNPNEVTFAGHAKGVRHPVNDGTSVFHWTNAMYETVYENWEQAREVLKTNAMAGSFKRYGSFKTPGNNLWHYSGTFYWFRNKDVFERDWRRVDQKFFGTESWPGHLFKASETGCLFFDDTGDLYNLSYWKKHVQPALEKWRESLPARV